MDAPVISSWDMERNPTNTFLCAKILHDNFVILCFWHLGWNALIKVIYLNTLRPVTIIICAYTVQFKYNFIFTRVYMHGTTIKLHCIPITCLRGPRFLLACNMHVSCNLSWKHTWNKINTRGTKHTCKILTHRVSSTATAVSNTHSPLVNSSKLSCKQCFNNAHIKSF